MTIKIEKKIHLSLIMYFLKICKYFELSLYDYSKTVQIYETYIF